MVVLLGRHFLRRILLLLLVILWWSSLGWLLLNLLLRGLGRAWGWWGRGRCHG